MVSRRSLSVIMQSLMSGKSASMRQALTKNTIQCVSVSNLLSGVELSGADAVHLILLHAAQLVTAQKACTPQILVSCSR